MTSKFEGRTRVQREFVRKWADAAREMIAQVGTDVQITPAPKQSKSTRLCPNPPGRTWIEYSLPPEETD